MSTHGKSKLLLAALLLGFFVISQAKGQQEAPTTPTCIVFVGTVEALNAVTLSSLKASRNTSIVVVENVLRKPEAVALAKGDRVTVLTEGTATPTKGVRALFFTEGSIFGESLAVRVLKWEPASAVGANAVAGEEAKAAAWIQAAAEKDLQASIVSADIIVVGRVRRIQPPSAPALAAESQRVSEHNPDWQEAIIVVEDTLKGPVGMAEVVVRFPSSVDVMWVGYPKFKVGQEGTFLLRQDRLSGATTATLEGKAVTAYMAISSKDALGKADSETIRRLLKK